LYVPGMKTKSEPKGGPDKFLFVVPF
jgi:hypothetical protein